jgi:hypothetical protein
MKWTQGDIEDYEADMRRKYPGCDVFFSNSAAYLLGTTLRTLQKNLSISDSHQFIWHGVQGEQIATNCASLTAFRNLRKNEKAHREPLFKFTGGWTVV